MLKRYGLYLAPGGLLVYATCSIIAEENEKQVAAFSAAHAYCQVQERQLLLGAIDRTRASNPAW